jgi:hypothetical protein
MEIKFSNIKTGDIFSEESHYKVTSKTLNSINFLHIESNTNVSIDRNYTEKLLRSADQYNEVKEVTKEDKKDGTPGIRTIFENIHSGQVFTVTFQKQDAVKSTKKFNAEVDEIVDRLCKELDEVKASKKGVAKWAKETIETLALNPISRVEDGEIRTLRGYKLQFNSRDGKYRCLDMDIERTSKETGERLVNINTITELIYNGIKYVVK